MFAQNVTGAGSSYHRKCLAQKSDMQALKVGGRWQVSRTAVGSRIKTKTQVTIAQPADDGTKPAISKREEMEPVDE